MDAPLPKKKIIKKGKPEAGVVPKEADKKKVPSKIPLAKSSTDTDEEKTKKKGKKAAAKKKKIEPEEDNNYEKNSKEKEKKKKKDNEEDNNVEVKKKIPMSFPKYQKKESDAETRKELEKALTETNKAILHFRNLGYLTRANGTLYYKEETKLEPTGIEVKITIQGSHFVVDTQGERTGNDIIKQLQGKWLPTIKSWKIPIYNLEKFEKCFDVIEKTKLTKEELEQLQKEIKEKHESRLEPGKINIEDNGDYFSLTSTNLATKTISGELKAQCQGKWRPEEKAWIVSKEFKEELDNILEASKEDGTIEDYEYTDGILKHATEDND